MGEQTLPASYADVKDLPALVDTLLAEREALYQERAEIAEGLRKMAYRAFFPNSYTQYKAQVRDEARALLAKLEPTP